MDQQQPKQKLKYRFVPQLPTEAAWLDRPFKEYYSAEDMFSALKRYEKQQGPFKHVSGLFRFRQDTYSDYRDGSEPTPYPNPRWWKTGAKSCHRKCCTVVPCGEMADNSEPAIIAPKPLQQSWQEFKRINGMCGAEEQYNHMSDWNKAAIERIVLLNIGWFHVEQQ